MECSAAFRAILALLLALHSPAAIVLTECRASTTECRGHRPEMIRLTYGGDVPPRNNTPAHHALVANPCDPENIRVTCSFADHPEDSYCDLGMLRLHQTWEEGLRFDSAELTYDHAVNEGIRCMMTFDHSSRIGRNNFTFSHGFCWPEVNDETVPSYRTSTGTRLTMKYYPECLMHRSERCRSLAVDFGGAAPGLGSGRRGSPVAVQLRLQNVKCVNYGDHMSFGRQSFTMFKKDGRRYRAA